MPLTSPLRAAAPLAVAAALLFSACGSDDDDDAAGGDGDGAATTTTAAGAAPADYAAVKDYLAEHTTRLLTATGKLREGAQQYYDLAESVDFDYDAAALRPRRRGRADHRGAPEDFRDGQPGVRGDGGRRRRRPVLADFDIILDAGATRGPRERRPVHDQDEGRQRVQAAGQLLLPHGDRALGHRAEFTIKGVKPDLDGDGKVEYGEALPDAASYLGGAATSTSRRRTSRRPPSMAADASPTSSPPSSS